QLLNLRLAPSPGLKMDASFGPKTESAVKAFQKKMSLPQTGVVNAQTWAMLGAKLEMIHHVTLFAQPTNMTCWSACATMLKGNVSVGPGAADLSDKGGLLTSKENREAFAASWGLRSYFNLQPSVAAYSNFLPFSPIIMGVRWPTTGGHVVVVAGMWSDGTDQGTTLLIYDPWPVNVGKVYTTPMLNMRITGSAVGSFTGILTR
ncbi:MAG TPA: peptidoglycan-binding protein, partial [Bryobacteraceae bacterium]|nr:peptidoglycan-binding protein [Bryobacteraceae bacterium]